MARNDALTGVDSTQIIFGLSAMGVTEIAAHIRFAPESEKTAFRIDFD